MSTGSFVTGSGGTTPVVRLKNMSTRALSKVFTQKALHFAWNTIYSKASSKGKNTAGIDDISLNDFSWNQGTNLRNLWKDIHEHRFEFQALRPFVIPKTDGNFRVIAVPTVQDRIVQRVLVDYLSERYKDVLSSKISYGFVKHKGVQQAAKAALNIRSHRPFVFKTDITKFFDNISRSLLKEQLKRVIRERSLHPILFAAIDCEIDEKDARVKKLLKDVKRGRGLRQGMPLSPILSNIFLGPFDRAIHRAGYHAVRYADDLIFLANNREECIEIAEFCRVELQKLELRIPSLEEETKSLIYEPHEAADFLGLQIVRVKPRKNKYELQLSKKQREKIRDELLQLADIRFLNSKAILLKDLGRVINSRINGYMAVYSECSNFTELSKELLNIEQKVLRRIYENGLGIHIATLTPESRVFLGLK